MKNEQKQSLGKNQIMSSFAGKKVAVAGDIMLDRFVYGNVTRLSPEAPVPILAIDRETQMPGGASNVLANLSALGVNARLIGLIGNDEDGEILNTLLKKLPFATVTLVKDASRPTTVKTRFVNNQTHLMRADRETTHAAPDAVQKEILRAAQTALDGADILVLSDYAKGVLANGIAQKLIALAQKNGVRVIADPKGKDFTIYRGTSVITPNRKELAESTGMNATTDDEIVSAARQLIEKTGIETVIVTRSEDGMSVIEKNGAPLHLPAFAATAIDVSGAGDTVIAALAASLAAGADMADAARLASIAAAIAVGKSGTSSVSHKQLADAPDTPQEKIVRVLNKKGKWDEQAAIVKQWQAQGLKVGFTNGCFDILHFGHVTYLQQAREKCDRLVVALNADASVRRLKGPERPLHDEQSRAFVMGALACVDLALLFGDDTHEKDMPCDIIAALQPDIHFKGGDYTEDQLPEAKIVRAYGGDVCIMPLQEGHSTTSTIKKMKSS